MHVLPLYFQQTLQKLPLCAGIPWIQKRSKTPGFVISVPESIAFANRTPHYLPAQLHKGILLELPLDLFLTRLDPLSLSLLLNLGDQAQRGLLPHLSTTQFIDVSFFTEGSWAFSSQRRVLWPEMYRRKAKELLQLPRPSISGHGAMTSWIQEYFRHKGRQLPRTGQPPVPVLHLPAPQSLPPAQKEEHKSLETSPLHASPIVANVVCASSDPASTDLAGH